MKKLIPILLWLAVFVCGGWLLIRNFMASPDVADIQFQLESGDGRTLSETNWNYLPAVKPIELVDHRGQPFSSTEAALGKPTAINFFFVACPTICRQLNGKVFGLAEEFKDTDLQFLSITCNPQEDTPDVLGRYAESLNAERVNQNGMTWRFLTGPAHRIQNVGRQFEVVLDPEFHTEDILLIDRWGRYRDRFKWDDPLELERFRIVATEVLQEKVPPIGTTIETRNTLAGVPHDRRKKSWLDEFFLTDSYGESFYSRDLTGKVWIGSFFFTRCPGICPKQNQYLSSLRDRLQGQHDVELVSISSDSQYDTPAVLSQYKQALGVEGDDWHFLTGDPTYIQRVSAEFFRVSLQGAAHHSSELFVVDRWGNPRGRFDWQEPGIEASLLELVERLEAEASPNDRLAAKRDAQRDATGKEASEPAGDRDTSGAESRRKDRGRTELGGIEPGGNELGGKDVGGKDVGGNELGGEELSGKELGTADTEQTRSDAIDGTN